MRTVMIFGQLFQVVENNNGRNEVIKEDNRIIVGSHSEAAETILDEYLQEQLSKSLYDIFDQIAENGKLNVFGDIEFKVSSKIDGNKDIIAKLKGNRILVKTSAIALPINVLKYIVSHEIAHVTIKKHTSKFWKTVELICPDYEQSQQLLNKVSRETMMLFP